MNSLDKYLLRLHMFYLCGTCFTLGASLTDRAAKYPVHSVWFQREQPFLFAMLGSAILRIFVRRWLKPRPGDEGESL